jgi:hypothetical protein
MMRWAGEISSGTCLFEDRRHQNPKFSFAQSILNIASVSYWIEVDQMQYVVVQCIDVVDMHLLKLRPPEIGWPLPESGANAFVLVAEAIIRSRCSNILPESISQRRQYFFIDHLRSAKPNLHLCRCRSGCV